MSLNEELSCVIMMSLFIETGNDVMKNVGTIDRSVRVLAGLVLLSLVFFGPQTPWGWIGVVPLFTAFLGWCPAYTLFGINTCKTHN